MRQAWIFFVGNLTYFAGMSVTAILIFATVKITTRDMRRSWKRELNEYGPEIVKHEIGKRERMIARQGEELDKLRVEQVAWTETRQRLLKILTEALEWLQR